MDFQSIDLIIIRYLNQEASAEDCNTLWAWLSENEENKKTFRSLKDIYDLGHIETDIKESDTANEWEKLHEHIETDIRESKSIKRLFTRIAIYAAVFIVGMLCAKLLTDRFTDKNQKDDMSAFTYIETGKGERSKVILPDSTVVWLNSCSTISYNRSFGNKERKIALKGEAFFDVKKQAGIPFIVTSDSLTFQVTGTTFNIYSFDNDNMASLVLVEGTLRFEYNNVYSAYVAPGELVEFDKTNRKTYCKKVNTRFYTSWRFGELMFEKMTFEELATRLERNFNVRFVFRNEKVKRETFGGTFRHYDSLETIMKVISTGTKIKYKIEKDIIYIQ